MIADLTLRASSVAQGLPIYKRSEMAVFVLRHHTRMIANQDGSVYSTRCSAAYAVYREDQWQRRSKHTELES